MHRLALLCGQACYADAANSLWRAPVGLVRANMCVCVGCQGNGLKVARPSVQQRWGGETWGVWMCAGLCWTAWKLALVYVSLTLGQLGFGWFPWTVNESYQRRDFS